MTRKMHYIGAIFQTLSILALRTLHFSYPHKTLSFHPQTFLPPFFQINRNTQNFWGKQCVCKNATTIVDGTFADVEIVSYQMDFAKIFSETIPRGRGKTTTERERAEAGVFY